MELTYRSAGLAIESLDACVTLNRVSDHHVGQMSSFRIAEMLLPVTEVKARAGRSLGRIGRSRDDSVLGVTRYSSKAKGVGILRRSVGDGSIDTTGLSASLNMWYRHLPWVPSIRKRQWSVKRRQDFDGTATSKLTRLHVVELILSPFSQTLTFDRHAGRHVDRVLVWRLNEFESIGPNMNVGRG